jgi:hypothetical protein
MTYRGIEAGSDALREGGSQGLGRFNSQPGPNAPHREPALYDHVPIFLAITAYTSGAPPIGRWHDSVRNLLTLDTGYYDRWLEFRRKE